jgi:hypothetical protein
MREAAERQIQISKLAARAAVASAIAAFMSVVVTGFPLIKAAVPSLFSHVWATPKHIGVERHSTAFLEGQWSHSASGRLSPDHPAGRTR